MLLPKHPLSRFQRSQIERFGLAIAALAFVEASKVIDRNESNGMLLSE